MPTLSELLDTSTVFTIDSDLRTINVPASFKNVGVYNDRNVKRIGFSIPRYYDDNLDLSEFNIYINYVNAAGFGDIYIVEDKTADTDSITFSWLLGEGVFASQGQVSFNVCMKLSDADSIVQKEFNTTITTVNVLQGLEIELADEEIQYVRDVIAQLVAEADSSFATAVEKYLDEYLDEHPEKFETDATLTESGKPADAKATGDAINEVKKSVSDGKTLVATAITDKGVATESTDTFATMADNISQIETGKKTDTVTASTALANRITDTVTAIKEE